MNSFGTGLLVARVAAVAATDLWQNRMSPTTLAALLDNYWLGILVAPLFGSYDRTIKVIISDLIVREV
jgi:hypothetical protein